MKRSLASRDPDCEIERISTRLESFAGGRRERRIIELNPPNAPDLFSSRPSLLPGSHGDRGEATIAFTYRAELNAPTMHSIKPREINSSLKRVAIGHFIAWVMYSNPEEIDRFLICLIFVLR